jgi:hypothetical protein
MTYIKLLAKHLVIYFPVVLFTEWFIRKIISYNYCEALFDPVYLLTFLVFFTFDLIQSKREKRKSD